MPDVPMRQPHFLEDIDVEATITVLPEDRGSIRRAKERLGLIRPRLDPNRIRIRCQREQIDGRSCWREAHVLVEDWHLCPDHAADVHSALITLGDDDEPVPAPEPVEPAPKKGRPPEVAGYPRNRPDRPSKTPQGRQGEYAKAKAKRGARR